MLTIKEKEQNNKNKRSKNKFWKKLTSSKKLTNSEKLSQTFLIFSSFCFQKMSAYIIKDCPQTFKIMNIKNILEKIFKSFQIDNLLYFNDF